MPQMTSTASRELEEYEREGGRLPFLLNIAEAKLLGIAGVGFFLDAYDLFIINPVCTMLQYRLYNGGHLPANMEGFVKAGANIGSVIGQFGFGYAADALGRKAVYGKELMIIIFATIMTITTPTGEISPYNSLVYLGMWRILLGVGVGGDYPMSASITSERSNLRKRGTMLAYIFSNQGWGSFVGSLITIIVLEIYKPSINGRGEVSKLDGVWRIVVGLSLVPSFATLYQRLTLGESKRFKDSQAQPNMDTEMGDSKKPPVQGGSEDVSVPSYSETSSKFSGNEKAAPVDVVVKKQAHFKEFLLYFSEWRHAKILIGTCVCWFLLDIAFYGINLNQNVVLMQMGYAGNEGTAWERIFKISTGGIIITALGMLPGYYATVLTIEILGRKWIQIQGFLLAALFLGILAGKFYTLGTAPFIVCFAFLQFFFNFGPNATTYCYPAEVFPTRYRAFAHGISAACGKIGAIISALAFNTLSKRIGTPAILWIFFGCCIVGAGVTFLLPEVKGRDPDEVLAQELRESAAAGRGL